MQFGRVLGSSALMTLAASTAGCFLFSDETETEPTPACTPESTTKESSECPETIDPPEPTPETGLVVIFTIEEVQADGLCSYYGAINAEVNLYQNGIKQAEKEAPCEEFKVELLVKPGLYNGTLALVNGSGESVQPPLSIEGVNVVDGDKTTITRNFK